MHTAHTGHHMYNSDVIFKLHSDSLFEFVMYYFEYKILHYMDRVHRGRAIEIFWLLFKMVLLVAGSSCALAPLLVTV